MFINWYFIKNYYLIASRLVPTVIMPRSKRGIKWVLPNQTDLECAVNDVQNKSLTVSEAVSIYKVSKPH